MIWPHSLQCNALTRDHFPASLPSSLPSSLHPSSFPPAGIMQRRRQSGGLLAAAAIGLPARPQAKRGRQCLSVRPSLVEREGERRRGKKKVILDSNKKDDDLLDEMIGHDDYFNARSSIGSSLNPPHFSQSVSGVPVSPSVLWSIVRFA